MKHYKVIITEIKTGIETIVYDGTWERFAKWKYKFFSRNKLLTHRTRVEVSDIIEKTIVKKTENENL